MLSKTSKKKNKKPKNPNKSKKSKKTRKNIGNKAKTKFFSNLKSKIATKKKLKTHKSYVLNRSQQSTPHQIYGYKIMSTVFKNSKTNYYDKFVSNVIPNLIIDLEPYQEIIVSSNFIKYVDKSLTDKVIRESHLSNVSMFSKTVKLIKFTKISNETDVSASLCLKPKLPCNIEILNINPDKSYTINPVNILGYSTNIHFSVHKKNKYTVSEILIFSTVCSILLGIGLFAYNLSLLKYVSLSPLSIPYSYLLKSKFNMLDVKSIKGESGIIFLAAYGDVKKRTLKKGNTFNVRLGQIVAYESTVKVSLVEKINFDKNKTENQFKNPNKHGIPLNYYITFKGVGSIYYQELDYFEYSYKQLGMFDKNWVGEQ